MKDSLKEKWLIACAAWCNVTPEHFAKVHPDFPKGSREGWARVFKVVEAMASARVDEDAKLRRCAIGILRSDRELSSDFREQVVKMIETG